MGGKSAKTAATIFRSPAGEGESAACPDVLWARSSEKRQMEMKNAFQLIRDNCDRNKNTFTLPGRYLRPHFLPAATTSHLGAYIFHFFAGFPDAPLHTIFFYL